MIIGVSVRNLGAHRETLVVEQEKHVASRDYYFGIPLPNNLSYTTRLAVYIPQEVASLHGLSKLDLTYSGAFTNYNQEMKHFCDIILLFQYNITSWEKFKFRLVPLKPKDKLFPQRTKRWGPQPSLLSIRHPDKRRDVVLEGRDKDGNPRLVLEIPEPESCHLTYYAPFEVLSILHEPTIQSPMIWFTYLKRQYRPFWLISGLRTNKTPTQVERRQLYAIATAQQCIIEDTVPIGKHSNKLIQIEHTLRKALLAKKVIRKLDTTTVD